MSNKILTPEEAMSLPDWAFGQRFPISTGAFATESGNVFDISNDTLPDICVVWEVVVLTALSAGNNMRIYFKMGDYLPTGVVQFNALPDIFKGLAFLVGNVQMIGLLDSVGYYRMQIKKLWRPQGQRLVNRFEFVGSSTGVCQVNMVISTVPKRMPEWLSSGLA